MILLHRLFKLSAFCPCLKTVLLFVVLTVSLRRRGHAVFSLNCTNNSDCVLWINSLHIISFSSNNDHTDNFNYTF